MARRDRARIAPALALVAAAAWSTDAAGAGIRWPVPVAARARLDVRVVTAEGTAPWKWDAQSRSPLDGSRFMADLTTGEDRTGVLYLKGAASWSDTDDALGRVAFTIEQGDYLLRRAFDSGALTARLFGDERRYFTGDLGTALMEDDVVERFVHRLGAGVGAERGVFGAGYLASSLDEGTDLRVLQRAVARVSGRHAHAALTYQHTHPPTGEDHAVTQAEAAGHFRGLSVIASYALSGFGSGLFVPSGSFGGGGGYVEAAPGNSATWAEARLRRLALDDVAFDLMYRYQTAGEDFVNDLASTPPGCEFHGAGVYASHRRLALDGRLVWSDEERFALGDSRRRALEAMARAFLRDNAQVLVRGGTERREFEGREESDAGFVAGSYRRELQRILGGVHAMLDGIGEDAQVRAGVEARVNWSATSAFYGRCLLTGDTERSDAVYARLEFRPTGRTWVTLAWGRSDVGDAPYPLDDRDGLPAHGSGDVVTLTVRGDF